MDNLLQLSFSCMPLELAQRILQNLGPIENCLLSQVRLVFDSLSIPIIYINPI